MPHPQYPQPELNTVNGAENVMVGPFRLTIARMGFTTGREKVMVFGEVPLPKAMISVLGEGEFDTVVLV